MAKTGPAPLLDLVDFVPADDRQRFLLIRGLVEANVGPSQAWTILEVLERLGRTGDDGLGASPSAMVARSRYRKMLHRLGGPPWSGGRQFEDKGA